MLSNHTNAELITKIYVVHEINIYRINDTFELVEP